VSWIATSISPKRGAAVEAVRSFVAVATITSRQLLPNVSARHLPPTVRQQLEAQRWERTRETVEIVKAALTDALIDTFAVAGPPEMVRGRLTSLNDAGIDQVSLLLTPVRGQTMEDAIDQAARVIGVFAPETPPREGVG
jgi:hypothetical protein